MERPPPSAGARTGLVVANVIGAGLCGLAATQMMLGPAKARSFGPPEAWEPLQYALIGIAAGCLFIGVPAGVQGKPGPRSMARALAAVGVALGGAASAVLYAFTTL